MFTLLKLSLKMLGGLASVLGLMHKLARTKREIKKKLCRKKESTKMKKTTLIAIVAALAAVAGALVAIAVYLRRREKELDEYEKLLFSEEFEDETPAEEAVEESEEASAEDAPVEETPAEETPAE